MENETRQRIPLKDLYPVIRQATEAGGELLIYPTGDSMRPTIRPERGDGVLLCALDRVQRGDILLYRRASGEFVLHRVIGVTKKGSFILKGDAQFAKEYVGKDCELIAKAKRIVRKRDEHLFPALFGRIYRVLWRISYPLRYVLYRIGRRLGRAKRKG